MDQLLITYSAFVKTSPIMAIKEGRASAAHKLKVYDLVIRKVLYNFLIQSGTPIYQLR